MIPWSKTTKEYCTTTISWDARPGKWWKHLSINKGLKKGVCRYAQLYIFPVQLEQAGAAASRTKTGLGRLKPSLKTSLISNPQPDAVAIFALHLFDVWTLLRRQGAMGTKVAAWETELWWVEFLVWICCVGICKVFTNLTSFVCVLQGCTTYWDCSRNLCVGHLWKTKQQLIPVHTFPLCSRLLPCLFAPDQLQCIAWWCTLPDSIPAFSDGPVGTWLPCATALCGKQPWAAQVSVCFYCLFCVPRL